jgi:16S rRNA (guanine966-N2)-methyltransferase
MRITGGESRGRAITGPAGEKLRPTGSKVRQAFFNILSNKLYSASFLDLCAGTGIMGIEALSRGASSLISVEEDRKAAKSIEANLKHLGYEAEVICGDVRKVLNILAGQTFDIIFADPPYKSEIQGTVLRMVEKHKLLADEGVLVIEHLKTLAPPENCESLVRSSLRNYGQTSLSFYTLDGK